MSINLPHNYQECLSQKVAGKYDIAAELVCSITVSKKDNLKAFWDCHEYQGYTKYPENTCTAVYINPAYGLPENFAECQKQFNGSQNDPGAMCKIEFDLMGARDQQLADHLLNDCWKLADYTGAFGYSCTLTYLPGTP